MARDRGPTEFGGVPGLIQPDPHEPTPSETLRLIYVTESSAPRSPDIPPDEDFIPLTDKKG